MTLPARVDHELVRFIPDELAPDRLYVSREYETVVHSCLCGCGERVVTPLGPTEWSLVLDWHGPTLRPSVGNWSFGCQSHYWIRDGKVFASGRLSRGKIQRIRDRDRQVKKRLAHPAAQPRAKPGLLQRLRLRA